MENWENNPGVLSRQESLTGDPDLRAFAETLDDRYVFIDLRNARIGQGYSWGRFGVGPEIMYRRFGENRLFALQKKEKERTWLQKIFGV